MPTAQQAVILSAIDHSLTLCSLLLDNVVVIRRGGRKQSGRAQVRQKRLCHHLATATTDDTSQPSYVRGIRSEAKRFSKPAISFNSKTKAHQKKKPRPTKVKGGKRKAHLPGTRRQTRLRCEPSNSSCLTRRLLHSQPTQNSSGFVVKLLIHK